MKLLPLLALALISPALSQTPLKVGEMTTKTGKDYKDVTVTEKRPDGVTIMHAGGTARIPHEDLPPLVRIKLGGFDAKEAEAARKEADEMAKANEAAHESAMNKVAPDADPATPGPAQSTPRQRVEPRNRDKLLVKPVRYGGGLRLEITGTAGALPLRLTCGGWSMTVDPWTSKRGTTWGSDGYIVRAWENDVIVDQETSRQKTGLGGDTSLRKQH